MRLRIKDYNRFTKAVHSMVFTAALGVSLAIVVQATPEGAFAITSALALPAIVIYLWVTDMRRLRKYRYERPIRHTRYVSRGGRMVKDWRSGSGL